MNKKYITHSFVECNSEKHKISISKSKALVFHNHKNGFRGESENCECANILNYWRTGRVDKLPLELSALREHTLFENIEACSPNEQLSQEETLHLLKTQIALEKSLRKCKNEVLRKFIGLTFFFSDNEDIKTSDYLRVSRAGHITLFSIPKNWLTEIYQKGLSVINGRVVTRIIKDSETGKEKALTLDCVIAGRFYEPLVFEVYTLPDGKKSLRWPGRVTEKDYLKTLVQECYSSEIRLLAMLFDQTAHKIIKIICGESGTKEDNHDIKISDKGRLWFCGHEKNFIKNEKLLESLGGKAQGCYAFYKHFLSYRPHVMPDKPHSSDVLIDKIKKSIMDKREMRGQQSQDFISFLCIEDLYFRQILLAIKRTIKSCTNSYLRAVKEVDISSNSSGAFLGQLRLSRGWDNALLITGSFSDWHKNVYKRGLGVVCGYFVTNAWQEECGQIHATILESDKEFDSKRHTEVLIKGVPGNYYFVRI